MELDQITIFKLILYSVGIILLLILIIKLSVFSNDQAVCGTLMVKEEVMSSSVEKKCPEGYYPNFGKFKDVKSGMVCCVKYT